MKLIEKEKKASRKRVDIYKYIYIKVKEKKQLLTMADHERRCLPPCQRQLSDE